MMETSAEHNSICNKNCSIDNDMDVLKSTTDTTTADKLNMKYDNLTDADDDKCVNSQKICTNNLKNAKIIHNNDDTDCNVVIDNNDSDSGNGNGNDNNQTTKQLQQQQQSQIKKPPFELSPQPQPPPSPPPLTSTPSPSPPQQQQQPSTYGCKHYKRKAKFVTPCCGKFFNCRYCHDENEDHHFDRKTLTELICTNCDTRQKVQAECEKCGVRFGKFTCLICNLFDDEDKDQYHCDGCGICRIGGRNNFFHCEVCNMCLPLQLKTDGHRCVENVSRSNCPVCLGDIHTSRYPCHIPDCGHLLHKTCFDQLLASGHYVCPTCQTSMIDMTKLWEYLDTQAQNLPVPKSHENSIVDIFCNDCFKQSTVKFHFIGLKCANCGGYNTTKNIKSRSFTFPSTKDNPSTSA